MPSSRHSRPNSKRSSPRLRRVRIEAFVEDPQEVREPPGGPEPLDVRGQEFLTFLLAQVAQLLLVALLRHGHRP
jgi:hypothetical protein